MKKYLLYFISISYILSSCSKYNISEEQSKAFYKIFGNDEEDIGYDIIQTNDEGYIVIGTKTTEENGKDIYVVKTNRYGNKVIEETFGHEYDDEGSTILSLPDRGYLICGTYSKSEDNKNFYVALINEELDIIFERNYGGPKNDELNSAIMNSDGDFILVGSSHDNNTDLKESYWMKVSSEGDSIYHTSGGLDEAICITQLSNGEYMVVGHNTSNPAMGIQIFASTFSDENPTIGAGTELGGTNNENVSSCTYLDNENIIITGKIFGNGNKDSIYLAHLRLTSSTTAPYEVIWEKNFGWGLNDEATDVTLCDDGNLIIAGSSESKSNGKYDALLMKVSFEGQILFSNNFGFQDDQKANAVIQTTDGGYVMTGSTTFEENSMIFMLKTKPDGELKID